MLLTVVASLPNKGVTNDTRITRRNNHVKQLHKTLHELSTLTKTSTTKPGVVAKVDNALYDIVLLTKSICSQDKLIEENE